MATHELKTWPEPFEAIWSGRKKAEYRDDDRTPPYAVGDRLHLREFDPSTFSYTGREIAAKVTDIRRGEVPFGFPPGKCMMSIDDLTRYPKWVAP